MRVSLETLTLLIFVFILPRLPESLPPAVQRRNSTPRAAGLLATARLIPVLSPAQSNLANNLNAAQGGGVIGQQIQAAPSPVRDRIIKIRRETEALGTRISSVRYTIEI